MKVPQEYLKKGKKILNGRKERFIGRRVRESEIKEELHVWAQRVVARP